MTCGVRILVYHIISQLGEARKRIDNAFPISAVVGKAKLYVYVTLRASP